MAQEHILTWLVAQRRKNPHGVYRLTDIAKGANMSLSTCSLALRSLVRAKNIELIELVKEQERRYRISDKTFQSITGEYIEALYMAAI